MIELAGITLGSQCPALDRFQPIDLSGLVYVPQTALRGDSNQPPPVSPQVIEYRPGTLDWPLGASRFAVGQFLASDTEVAELREAMPDGDPVPLTLTLGGTVTATMFVLSILPLQLNRDETPVGSGGFYLVVLVDARYFLQFHVPAWEITSSTTWDELDGDVTLYLDAFAPEPSTADPVPSEYLQPSTTLAPPARASQGIVNWAGPLIDSICLASGRKFVANLDGSFVLQNWDTADSLDGANRDDNAAYLMTGGLLAFPPATEQTTGLYTLPEEIAVVFPGRTGDAETAPLVSTHNFASVYSAAGYSADDEGIYTGRLTVGTSLWWDGTNTTALDNYAEQFAVDWYAWLRGKSVVNYAGVCDLTPNGFTDQILWCIRREQVWTRYYRGSLNPRPLPTVGGYSGVAPVRPTYTDIIIINVIIEGDVEFNDATVIFNSNTTTTFNGPVEFNEENTYTGPNYFNSATYINGQYYQNYYSYAQFVANQNNWTLNDTEIRYRISSDAEYRKITGIAPGADPGGRLIYLYNVGDYTILITNEDGASTAANRILTATGNTFMLPPTHMICLCYDQDDLRWRISEQTHQYLDGTETYSLWSGDEDNFDINRAKSQHRIGASSGVIVWSGIQGGLPGLQYRFINIGDYDILLLDEDASDPENQFKMGANRYFHPSEIIMCEYDGPSEKWRVYGCGCLRGAPYQVPYVPSGGGTPIMTDKLLFDQEKVLIIERDDDSPQFAMLRTGPSNTDLTTGDVMGIIPFKGRSSSTNQDQATIEGEYTGDGTTRSGSIKVKQYTAGSQATSAEFVEGQTRIPAASASSVAGYDSNKGLISITIGTGLTLDTTDPDAPELSASGSGGSIIVTDGTVTVDPTSTLDFDPTYFEVTDSGGGTATVSLELSGILPDATEDKIVVGDGTGNPLTEAANAWVKGNRQHLTDGIAPYTTVTANAVGLVVQADGTAADQSAILYALRSDGSGANIAAERLVLDVAAYAYSGGGPNPSSRIEFYAEPDGIGGLRGRIEIVMTSGGADTRIKLTHDGYLEYPNATASTLAGFDGSKQLISISPDTGWSTSSVTPTKSIDGAAATLDDTRNVLGTLIDALIAKGVLSS